MIDALQKLIDSAYHKGRRRRRSSSSRLSLTCRHSCHSRRYLAYLLYRSTLKTPSSIRERNENTCGGMDSLPRDIHHGMQRKEGGIVCEKFPKAVRAVRDSGDLEQRSAK
ncbi:hypothetical protein MPH_00508 [Macrophomina phaseolina MS6]|uniref:Uncharacterized protein n=1 Tax=Macrophomina phaseolina (strain MS6) TaxID=1126212 RepID=K2SZU5_MACPH|nr:hypothetical protein MPH_00508 [Macrophomina phaseolina MS6]